MHNQLYVTYKSKWISDAIIGHAKYIEMVLREN